MYIQLNVDESLNLLKKKHDMYIQLNVHESLNLLKKKHYATLH
jgi:3-methyladenine DNA glycosylase AlkC